MSRERAVENIHKSNAIADEFFQKAAVSASEILRDGDRELMEKLQQEHEQGDGYTEGSPYPPRLTAREVNALRERIDRAKFVVKDSGQRQEFTSGMVRDTNEGKIRYDLVADGPMLKRWAEHLTLGAKKYEPRNWMKAQGRAEYERFRESAFRHFMDWWEGKTDEDHAAGVFFNLNGAEHLKERLSDGEI